MTNHRTGRGMKQPELRPDRYLCPSCERWRGEHMRTRLLARHSAPGGGPYDLCTGSLAPIRGLPTQGADTAQPPQYWAPYTQPCLF